MPDLRHSFVASEPAPSRSVLRWIPYVYLLRVQILTAAFLIGLPLIALRLPALRALLNGIFDVDYQSTWQNVMAAAEIAAVSVAICLTVVTTAWVTLINGPERFGTPSIGTRRFQIGGLTRVVSSLGA